MSKSYDRNIERLKANQAKVSAQEQNITTAAAKQRGDWMIREAEDFATKLTPFSTALQEWKDKDIKKKIEEGRQDLEKAKLEKAKLLTDTQKRILAIEDAKKAGDLAFGIKDAFAQEKELQELKGKLLDQNGTVGYPDAERLAKLSPWQQVGYVQEAIKNGMNAFPDMLAHSMQNGQENIVLGGIEFNAAEIKDNKLAFEMKQHAVHYYSDKIYRNLGLDKYSKEMLDRSKVHETIRTAKEAQIAKHRREYNIESSMLTRKKAKVAFNSSEKTGEHIELFLLTWGNTVDTNNKRMGNKRALDALFGMIAKEGAELGGDTSIINKYKDLPLPESLRQRINAKKGATFSSHWPERFKTLHRAIKDGNKEIVDQQLEDRETAKKEIKAKFYDAVEKAYVNNSTLSARDVKFWKEQFRNIGTSIPEDLKNYETASQRVRGDDEIAIQNHIDHNGGITTQQLKSFHPLAAGKFRKEAEAYEQSIFEKSSAEDLIKGSLDETFANMGVKDREKSMAYQTASYNAKQDFFKQYHQYTAFGLPSDLASHLAVHGVSGVDTKEFSPELKTYLKGRQGVAEEINAKGENSKYTRAGLHLEKTVGSDFTRARWAMTAGKEMLESKEPWNLRKTKILGGDYGQAQIDAIKKNIEKYGFYRGIAMSEEHTQFYKAIMSTRNMREGGWWGLLHDQLIVDDPKSGGLERFPPPVPSVLPLLNRKVKNKQGEEEDVEDQDGVLEVSSSAINAANNGAVLYAYNTITDADNYYNNKSNVSVFDQLDQLPAHLGGMA